MAAKSLKTLKQAFEKSGKDVEPKGMKENSPADKKLDKKQFAGFVKNSKLNDAGVTSTGKSNTKTNPDDKKAVPFFQQAPMPKKKGKK